MSSLPKTIEQSMCTVQGVRPQVVDSAWTIGSITKPMQSRIVRDFYRGLTPRKIQINLYSQGEKCPPVDFILDVIRLNTSPKGTL